MHHQSILVYKSRMYKELKLVSQLIILLVITTVYTCTGNKDYTSEPYNITFHAGDVLAEFNISLNLSDDNINQNNKCFPFIIDPSSLPNYVSVGEPGNATVIVLDNKGKLNSLSVHMYIQARVCYLKFSF